RLVGQHRFRVSRRAAAPARLEFSAPRATRRGGGGMNPYLSVIVPAHNSVAVLDRCLTALASSGLPRESWELIVVDDGSTDATELVAARYADVAVRLAGNPHGPAYARNRGAEASRGEVLVFVDADVVVHPDTLARIAITLARR